MGAVQVIVVSPVFDNLPRMAVAGEEVLVEAFITQTSIEAFHKAILHRLSRRNVMPLDGVILLPFKDGIRRQLGPVVRDNHAGIASPERDLVQLAADTLAGQRVVDHGCKALSAEVVENTENAKAPAVDQSIRDEVQAPALVRSLRDCHRRSGSQGSFATATLAHGQPLLPVEPIELLPVDLNTFPLQQDMQATISEATPLAGQFLEPRTDRDIISPRRPIAEQARIDVDQAASSALRVALFFHCPGHGVPP